MAAPGRKAVTAMEPAVLFIAAGVFGVIALLGIVTGWVWIPGSSRGDGHGNWINRADSLGEYLIYLTIMAAAGIGVLLMALDRLRKFNAQGRRG